MRVCGGGTPSLRCASAKSVPSTRAYNRSPRNFSDRMKRSTGYAYLNGTSAELKAGGQYEACAASGGSRAMQIAHRSSPTRAPGNPHMQHVAGNKLEPNARTREPGQCCRPVIVDMESHFWLTANFPPPNIALQLASPHGVSSASAKSAANNEFCV